MKVFMFGLIAGIVFSSALFVYVSIKNRSYRARIMRDKKTEVNRLIKRVGAKLEKFDSSKTSFKDINELRKELDDVSTN